MRVNAGARDAVIAVLRQLVGTLRVETLDERAQPPYDPSFREGWNERTRTFIQRIESTIKELQPSAGCLFVVLRALDDKPMSAWLTRQAAYSACETFGHDGVSCYVVEEVP